MKNNVFGAVAILILVFSVLGCVKLKGTRDEAPIRIQNAYFERLLTGTRLVVSLRSLPDVVLECVYFENRSAELKPLKENRLVYQAVFATQVNNIVMSDNPLEEYGNQLKVQKNTIPFKLKENECMISYINTKTDLQGYFKYNRLKEK